VILQSNLYRDGYIAGNTGVSYCMGERTNDVLYWVSNETVGIFNIPKQNILLIFVLSYTFV
jgi:hypothetical protein